MFSCNITQNLNNEIPDSNLHFVEYITNAQANCMFLTPIIYAEFSNIILDLKDTKQDKDCTPIKFFKLCCNLGFFFRQ